MKQQHKMLLVANLISNPIVTAAKAILTFVTFEFAASTRAWIIFQILKTLDNSPAGVGRKPIKLLLDRSWDDDLISHLLFVFRRDMYSSRVT